MGKSGRVRLSDLRKAYRLIHECRDLGHDPVAWVYHATDGARRLARAQVANLVEVRPPTPPSPWVTKNPADCGTAAKPGLVTPGAPRTVTENLADCGWCSAGQRALWWRLYAEERLYAQKGITLGRFLAVPRRSLTRGREQLVGDREWYASFELNELHRVLGIDDLMYSAHREEGGRLFGFTAVRAWGEGRFGVRQLRLVRLFHDELWRYLGTALVRPSGEPFARLPPRLREVLSCLLEGDGEKQVAARLGLSRHTVHEYVGQLYRRFGVCSRPELLALCLRLGDPTPTSRPRAGRPNEKG